MIICDYCNRRAKLLTGASVYPHRPDLYPLKFWVCEPCKAYVGCHKNSEAVPLGRLANADLRKAKSAAHAAFDPIWKNGRMKRGNAYLWLSERLGITKDICHIGMFDEKTCWKVVSICGKEAP